MYKNNNPYPNPEFTAQLSERSKKKLHHFRKKQKLTFRIKSRSDKDEDPKRKLMWGDYWVKHELGKELENLGLSAVAKDPDVFIHLFGSPTKGLSDEPFKILWLYSHPDRVNSENLKEYDMIYCASPHFIPKLRKMGYENVDLMLRLIGMPPKDRRYRVMECIEIVGLKKWMHHRPHEMSGGQQQRIGIARALAHHPRLILADEPTGELDSKTSTQIIGIFREIVESEGITILMTSHDPRVNEFVDEIKLLKDGQVLDL